LLADGFNQEMDLSNGVFCDGHVESPTLPFFSPTPSDAALRPLDRDHQPQRTPGSVILRRAAFTPLQYTNQNGWNLPRLVVMEVEAG